MKLFKSITFLFLLILLSSAQAASTCQNYFSNSRYFSEAHFKVLEKVDIAKRTSSNGQSVIVEIKHKYIRSTENLLLMRGFLELANGKLVFSIKTKNGPFGEYYDPDIKAEILFDILIHELGYEKIKTIEAEWFWNYYPEEERNELPLYSTNTILFVRSLSNGFTPIEAARATWTSRMATKYGFKDIDILGVKNRASYKSLIVHFSN